MKPILFFAGLLALLLLQSGCKTCCGNCSKIRPDGDLQASAPRSLAVADAGWTVVLPGDTL